MFHGRPTPGPCSASFRWSMSSAAITVRRDSSQVHIAGPRRRTRCWRIHRNSWRDRRRARASHTRRATSPIWFDSQGDDVDGPHARPCRFPYLLLALGVNDTARHVPDSARVTRVDMDTPGVDTVFARLCLAHQPPTERRGCRVLHRGIMAPADITSKSLRITDHRTRSRHEQANTRSSNWYLSTARRQRASCCRLHRACRTAIRDSVANTEGGRQMGAMPRGQAPCPELPFLHRSPPRTIRARAAGISRAEPGASQRRHAEAARG